MSIFSDQDIQQTKERATLNVAKEKPTHFGENMSAAWREFNNNDHFGELRSQRRTAWDDRIKKVKEITGQKLNTPWNRFGEDNFLGNIFLNQHRDITLDPDQPGDEYAPQTMSGVIGSMFDGVDNDLTEPQRLRRHEDELDKIRATLPPEQRKLIPTRDEIEKELKARAQKLEAESADIGRRATFGGFAGRLVGSGGASILQPEVLATLPIGAPLRAGIMSRILIESAIGAVSEAGLQGGVQAQRQELGLGSGFGHALENVASAAVGAGGLTLAGAGVVASVKMISKGGLEAFEKAIGRKATSDERVMVQQVQRDADVEAQTPYAEQTAAAYRLQLENEQIGYDAAIDGRPIDEGDIVSDPTVSRRDIEADDLEATYRDDIAPDEIEAIAAFRDLGANTGTAREAAKVLRDMGATERDLALPPRSPLVRDAEGLSRLDQEVFDMVFDEQLSEQFGAVIGRLIDDPRKQGEMAKLLNRLQPANKVEAESVVRQARDVGAVSDDQGKLFLDKAKVLDRSIKMIQRNADTLGEINGQRADTTDALGDYLQSNAHEKGLISDELEKAARTAQETGQYTPASRGFVQALTRAVDEGTLDGDAIARGRIDPQSTGQNAQVGRAAGDFEQVSDDVVDMFDEPNGKAAEDQANGMHHEMTQPEQEALLDFAAPMGERIDVEGNRVTQTQTIRDVMVELEETEEFVSQLELCKGGQS